MRGVLSSLQIDAAPEKKQLDHGVKAPSLVMGLSPKRFSMCCSKTAHGSPIFLCQSCEEPLGSRACKTSRRRLHPHQHLPCKEPCKAPGTQIGMCPCPQASGTSADVAVSSHLLGSSKGLPYPCLLRAALIGALMAAALLSAEPGLAAAAILSCFDL